MAAMTLRKMFTFFILASLLLFARADETTGGIQEEIEEALEEAYEQGKNLYDKLPPQGKFAVGAGVGLVGSRVAVKTAVTGVKVAGAAFIVTEALNYAGMFDNIPEDSKAVVNKVKNSALKSASNLRSTFRRRLGPNGLRKTIDAALDTEKVAACGFATGAFLGFLL